MSEVFDDTFDVFNGEIDNVASDFTDFIAALKGEIKFNVIEGNVETFSDLVRNYTTDIKPTMETALASIENINTNILPEIQTSCGNLPGLCDDFISSLDGILGQSLYENPPPALPDDIQSNLGNFSRILADVDQAISEVDIAGELAGLKEEINTIRAQFDDLLNTVRDIDIFRTSYEIPEYISSNFQYIHTGVLAVAGVLSLVLGLVLLGLTCGGCSRSGSGPARTGASLSCGAFSVFFLLAALLFVLCAALLLVGGISEKAVCKSLLEPEESQVFQLADKVLQQNVFNDLYNGTFNLSISEVIKGIHNNTPLYPLLHLDVIFDVEDLENWRVDFNIDDLVNDVKGSINTIIAGIVSQQSNIPSTSIIAAAAQIDNSLNPVIKDILETDLSTLIEDIITQIDDIISDPVVTDQSLKDSLLDLISELTNLENNTNSAKDSFQDILENPGIAENQNLTLESFANETFVLVDEAFLKIPENVSHFVNTTVESLLETIDNQIPVIVSSIEEDVGQTQILSNIYNATYTLTCLDIIAPVNCVWSGLGLTLLTTLFPLLMVICSLNKIFRSHRTRGGRARPYHL